jgi:hypothetical protein
MTARRRPQIGQAGTLMVALVVALLPHICCGNYAIGNLLADELVVLTEAKGALLWNAVGRIMRGDVLTLIGKYPDAVQIISTGIDAEKATGATLWIPWFASSLASAYAELGKFNDARRWIGEAVSAAEVTKDKWYEAEVNRIAGEITNQTTRMLRSRRRISSAHAQWLVNSERNHGNSAPP